MSVNPLSNEDIRTSLKYISTQFAWMALTFKRSFFISVSSTTDESC